MDPGFPETLGGSIKIVVKSSMFPKPFSTGKSRVECFRCGEIGHVKSNCKKKDKQASIKQCLKVSKAKRFWYIDSVIQYIIHSTCILELIHSDLIGARARQLPGLITTLQWLKISSTNALRSLDPTEEVI